MYEGPIEMIFSEIETKIVNENEAIVLQAARKSGVNVNKEELEKALRYDRDQYEKGYKDGRHDAISRCKDCKYFEYDSVAKVDGVPLIVAHEICSRWGDGCKTSEDGYCFLFEPQDRKE